MPGENNILSELFPALLPQLAKRFGVELPEGFGPEHAEKMGQQLFGSPSQKVGGQNYLIQYYQNRHLVSDLDFRKISEMVFAMPGLETTVQKFLQAMGEVVANMAEAANKKESKNGAK